MDRIMHRITPSLILLIALIITACHTCPEKSPLEQLSSVTGVVMFRPGYDAMPKAWITEPPESPVPPFRPHADVPIYLLRYPADILDRSSIIQKVLTDSLGQYEIKTAPGTYYLAPFIRGGIPKNNPFRRYDPPVSEELEINQLIIIEIRSGETTVQDFELLHPNTS